MPKITLVNTETGSLEDFEPIDAREILADAASIYKVADGTSERIGVQLAPNASGGVNIPQMHGADAEMQTGNSVDKYARQAVVKALPGDPQPPRAPMLKAALDQKGIAYPATAKKADLQLLFDNAPQ